jgi:hypothetical protein
MAILPNPDPTPTPVPTPPPFPDPKPMREPEPERLPDEEPLPNPDENDVPPKHSAMAVVRTVPWTTRSGSARRHETSSTFGNSSAERSRPRSLL